MKTHIIQLERYDDVISTRDKMSWSKAARILLVWPQKGRVLTRPLDLTLLNRYSRQSGAQLGLVTRSRVVRANAALLGIPVFDTAAEAQQLPWRPARRKKLESRRSPQERIGLLERRTRRFQPGRLENTPLRLLFFALGVVAVLGLMVFFLPSAQIILAPDEQEQRLSLPVWANLQIAAPGLSGGIPAQQITVVVEGQDALASTGQVTLPDQPAQGQVQFTNLGEQELTIPAGTVVLTLTQPAIRFQTTAPATLPPALDAQAEAPVTALQAGSSGNVDAGQIQAVEGAIGVNVSVTNLEPTTGGSDRSSPAPTGEDAENLHQRLLGTLRQTAESELQNQLTAGQVLLPETLRAGAVLEESYLPEVGSPADQLSLRLRVEFDAWTVLQKDLEQVALTALDANLPPGYAGVAGTLAITAQTEPSLVGESVRWEIDARRTLAARRPEYALREASLGLQAGEVQGVLMQLFDLNAPPQIRIWPSWWPRLPFLPLRIQVVQS